MRSPLMKPRDRHFSFAPVQRLDPNLPWFLENGPNVKPPHVHGPLIKTHEQHFSPAPVQRLDPNLPSFRESGHTKTPLQVHHGTPD